MVDAEVGRTVEEKIMCAKLKRERITENIERLKEQLLETDSFIEQLRKITDI